MNYYYKVVYVVPPAVERAGQEVPDDILGTLPDWEIVNVTAVQTVLRPRPQIGAPPVYEPIEVLAYTLRRQK